MEFFKTDEGKLHGIRIGGVFVVIAVLLSCGLEHWATPMCAARWACAIGWCVAFGGKRPGHPWPASFGSMFRAVGVILLFAGAFGQFYVLWRNH